MSTTDVVNRTTEDSMSVFERYLTAWVILCIVVGIALGKSAPQVAQTLDQMAIYVNDAPVVSIPIALCLFFMMYPIMVKIDFGEVVKAGKAARPVGLTPMRNKVESVHGPRQVARKSQYHRLIEIDLIV